MAKVIGVGGVFFKSPDPKAIGEWYQKHLGLPVEPPYGANFKPIDMPENSLTVWAPFKHDTDYFAPSQQNFMFNLIVDDVEQALAQVIEGGATQVGEVQKEDYGSFGWFIDPDGNKVELWQPA
jgi:predicted enzyme related to lactoylglutathione lyase